jgi:uncharacterized protein YodC (DUF2158 family)
MSADIIPLRRHGLGEGDAARVPGGPIMIVAIADAEIDADVTCVWFSRRRLKSGRFRGDALEIVARASAVTPDALEACARAAIAETRFLAKRKAPLSEPGPTAARKEP